MCFTWSFIVQYFNVGFPVIVQFTMSPSYIMLSGSRLIFTVGEEDDIIKSELPEELKILGELKILITKKEQFNNKNEKVVVEVKRIGSAFYDLKRSEQQVFNYLYITKIQNGILFVYRPGVKEISTWRQPDLGLAEKQYTVTTIAPKE